MSWEIRDVEARDVDVLWQMLFRASWSHLDAGSTVESVRRDPDLAHYVDCWGRDGDIGVIAHLSDRPLGAAWVRRLIGAQRHSAACVADDVPELAIAVGDGLEGRGIGSALLRALIERLPETSIVLTARSTNPAIALYERHGFEVIETITNRVATTSVKMLRASRISTSRSGGPAVESNE